MVETVKDMVYAYVERLPVGQKFSPRDIVSHIHFITNGKKSPMDGTVTRMLRKRRTDVSDVAVSNRVRSIYIKTARALE
jgi:hypothetical protein